MDANLLPKPGLDKINTRNTVGWLLWLGMLGPSRTQTLRVNTNLLGLAAAEPLLVPTRHMFCFTMSYP